LRSCASSDLEALAERLPAGPTLFDGVVTVEGGTRTATLTAATDCRLAMAKRVDIDKNALIALAEGHRREDN
jgi:hypothetical protein